MTEQSDLVGEMQAKQTDEERIHFNGLDRVAFIGRVVTAFGFGYRQRGEIGRTADPIGQVIVRYVTMACP